MKYYVIAGEASGDLHGSNMMKELKLIDKDADFRYWGGNLMQEQGGTLVRHIKDLAFMGFTEVVANIKKVLNNVKVCKIDVVDYQPDVLILIDYPGFNLKIAKYAKQKELKVFYYISPKLWAWKQYRIKAIKKYVDKMFVILPFEKEYYKQFNYNVDFVGNPLLDAIGNYSSQIKDKNEFIKENKLNNKPIIAILPGSRKHEIEKMLSLMLSLINAYSNYQFVVAGAPAISEEFYKSIIGDDDIYLLENRTYDLLKYADAALVTSGTATLETALFSVPQIVCYKISKLSHFIVSALIKIKYASLVNLIMDKEIVKELLQYDFTKENIQAELNKILFDEKYKSIMLNDYALLKDKLGSGGASKNTAQLIYSYLNIKEV